jgi:hypothetical protein
MSASDEGRRKQGTALLPLLLLLCALLHLMAASSKIPDDLVLCIQEKRCGLSDVCAFTLPSDSATGACLGEEECTNLTGHIMRINNGMDYGIAYTWDVMGEHATATVPNGTTGQVSRAADGSPRVVHVEKHSSRYINTQRAGTHTVRLYIGTEPIVSEVAAPDRRCTQDQACDDLLRVCAITFVGPHAPSSSSSSPVSPPPPPPLADPTSTPDAWTFVPDPNCADYGRHCRGFSGDSMYSGELRCVPQCLATYYADDFAAMADVLGHFDSRVLVHLIKQYPTLFADSGAGRVTVNDIMAMGADEATSGSTASIVVLSVIVVVLLLVILYMSWKWWYTVRRGDQPSHPGKLGFKTLA